MGTVLHPCDASVNDAGVFVSVPFSMGTVLHQAFRDEITAGTAVSVPFSMGTVLHPLLNSHILQHLYCVREALSSQIRFLRRTAPYLRILSLPYVSAIVCVLAFLAPFPHIRRLRQPPC